MKEEKATDQIWEGLGKLNEMQRIEERVLKAKEI